MLEMMIANGWVGRVWEFRGWFGPPWLGWLIGRWMVYCRERKEQQGAATMKEVGGFTYLNGLGRYAGNCVSFSLPRALMAMWWWLCSSTAVDS